MSISALAFPYTERQPNVRLKALAVANADDSARYVFQLAAARCSSIEKYDLTANQVLDGPLSYVENPRGGDVPLLVRIHPEFNRLKLNLTVSTAKTLVIAKTAAAVDAAELARRLASDDPDDSEISQIRYTALPSEAQIVVNDSFSMPRFSNGVLNVFVFETDAHKYRPLFEFSIWVDRSDVTPPKSDPVLSVKDLRQCLNFTLEDGPEFRKNVTELEATVPQVSKSLVSLQEETKNLENILRRLIVSKSKIVDIVQALARLNPLLAHYKLGGLFKKRLDHLVDPFTTAAKSFLTVLDKKYLDKVTHNLHEEQEITLKKNFEAESREYYNWLKKYLSNEKDRPQSKLFIKRQAFELHKFAYLNHLHNYLSNQYSNQLVENVFKFCNSDNTLSWPHEDLSPHQKVYLNFLVKVNSEKFKLHQMIKSCKSNEELTQIISHNSLNVKSDPADSIEVKEDNLDLVFTKQTVEELPHIPATANDTEISGLLYTLGGKGKQGWHKEWVVIKNGELREYSDWRTGSKPINQPILIAISNIKPIHQEKRQHCFEIHTAQGSKHIFQAINEDEKGKWIRVFQNVKLALINDESANATTRRMENQNLKLPPLERPVVALNDHSSSPISIKSASVLSQDYLRTVRSIPDSNNHLCADCGAADSVEWVSINFLVVMCIECSAVHRSLGSHVSKIRSLKLDNFDEEVEALLGYVNNKLHNSYLEHTLKDIDRGSFKRHEKRSAFITDKYAHKKFIATPVDDNQLIKSVQRIEIENVIKCVILGSDTNLKIHISSKSDEQKPKLVTLFEYSLRKYLVVETAARAKKLFVISELLILNGHTLEKPESTLDLTPEALAYWRSKYEKLT